MMKVRFIILFSFIFISRVTAPADMIVVGSGNLQNPKDVLTSTEINRLSEARKSDKTILLRSADEVTKTSSRPQKGNITWHFKMKNSRDVSWAASKAFIWDAARKVINKSANWLNE